MWGGTPTILVFLYGVYIGSDLIVYLSIWVYVFLAITDVLDGVVARAYGLSSPQGARLDAGADKWFDLPTLFFLSAIPTPEPIYLIIAIGIAVPDIIGQSIRGRSSPPEAGIVGKTKTTVKFIVIYLMSLTHRYPEIYEILKLEIVIVALLLSALILAWMSMGMKTKWYNEYARKYIKEYLIWEADPQGSVFIFTSKI